MQAINVTRTVRAGVDAAFQRCNSIVTTLSMACRKHAVFIFIFLWAGISAAADTTSPVLTTLSGVTYEDVSVTRFGQNFIVIKHKAGITKLYHQELPAGALDRLTKEIESRRRKQEEEIRFEEEQKNKGLVKYQGQWITQIQKAEIDQREREKELSELQAKEREKGYVARADQLVMIKSLRKVLFRVFQALPNGALCSMGYWDESMQTYFYAGEILTCPHG
jgi:hypothetical protein